MTKEEKDLVLKDLCARLPYGVYVTYRINKDETERATIFNGNYARDIMEGRSMWIDFKPHLRPMSSMTEEEKIELCTIAYAPDEMKTIEEKLLVIKTNAENATDFYNRHHLDYRGLIPMGLAIEAPEGLYKIE